MELEKEGAGCFWPDLDLMGNLVLPKASAVGGVRMRATILSEERSEGAEDEAQDNDDEREPLSTPSDDLMNIGRPRYGFANMFVNIFSDLVRDGMASEMLQLASPDEIPAEERRNLRHAYEQEAFNPDRYLEDIEMSEDYIYETAMAMVAYWNGVEDLTQDFANLGTTADTHCYFTEAEAAQLVSISYPFLPDNYDKQVLLLGLLDILYAFVYDHLVTQGEPTVESPWNTSTLSATLSWLDTFDDLSQVVQSSIRRSLIFPYIRNYHFAIHCWKQIATILTRGRRCVIRSLLRTRSILEQSEFHYLSNKLYIDPYLAWVQREVNDEDFRHLANTLEVLLKSNHVQKSTLGLNLVELEEEFLGYEEVA